MARVSVHWVETTTYFQEFEVDGFDPEGADTDERLEEAIVHSADFGQVSSVEDRQIKGFTVVRDGEETADVPAAKRTEEGFDF